VQVAVVRHADAGRRSEWTGDDLERPLSELGRAQADALVAPLLRAGAARLLSSPARRCRETLAPLAAALGRPVEVHEALGIPGPSGVPGIERLAAAFAAGDGHDGARAPAEEPPLVVACTHGEVIERLLGPLARPQGLAVPGPKAGIWWCRLDPASPLGLQLEGCTLPEELGEGLGHGGAEAEPDSGQLSGR
jgi:8-oxo-dGTP diphosphatase